MAKIIHTTKLFGGRETAQEVHRRYTWGPRAACTICGCRDVLIRITCAMSPRELVERFPNVAAKIMAQSDNGQIPSYMSKWGALTIFSEAFSCSTHQAAAERAAAHLPSYVYVDIDRGVGEDVTVVQVPRSMHLRRENPSA